MIDAINMAACNYGIALLAIIFMVGMCIGVCVVIAGIAYVHCDNGDDGEQR